MLDRESLLGRLSAGDIFHAMAPNGASLICVVVSASQDTIQARRVTSQEALAFDRITGIENVADRQAAAVIDSVEPLPPEIHNVFIALDEKYRAVHGQQNVFEQHPEYYKLSQSEKNALHFIDAHSSSNRLPPPAS